MTEPTIPPDALEQLRSLLKMLREAQTRSDERAKVTHERFNVFTTLLEAHDEVRLHTRFLHCLLDSQGCHDCQSCFLDLFFATLAEFPGKNHDDSQAEFNLPQPQTTWSIRKEASCGEFGQIDILLEQPEFGIAIENKINAIEQEDQLARYAGYLDKQHGNGLVLFLTLDGKLSTTHAGTVRYMRISYAEHILNWLEKCLRETHDIIPINQVLLQYRAVVLKLTGKNIESKAMKEISNFIKDHPDIIRFKNQIIAGIDEARVNFLNELADEIKKNLAADGFYITPLASNVGSFGKPGGGLFLTPPRDSILHHAPFKIWVENETGFLILGIVTAQWHARHCLPPDNVRIPFAPQSLFEQMKEQLKSEGCEMTKADGNWPTGWHNLVGTDDENLASLLDSKVRLDKNVIEICGRIRSYISILEKVTKANQPTSNHELLL